MICPNCNIEVEPIFTATPDMPHEGRNDCPNCRKFIGWKRKDKNIGKRPATKYTAEYFGIDYCEICLRKRNRLGKHETLTMHHILEYQDGNRNVIEVSIGGNKVNKLNLLCVCSHCERLIHHIRKYMNDHFGDLWDEYERMKAAIEQKELSATEYEDEVITTMKEIEKAPWEE